MPAMSEHAPRVLVVAGGLGLAVLAATVAGIPGADTIQLVGISFGVALLAFGAGTLVRRSRHRSGRERTLPGQAVIVALIPVASLAAGALVAARAMFVSTHDLAALVVIVAGAGTAGVLGALALAEELEAARRKAAAAGERERALERSRRELVAWVSHDLRTPLAEIRAMAEALDDGVVSDDATVARYHATMTREADHLSRLVDDLFELSRLHAQAAELAVERIPLAELIADAVAAAGVGAHSKGVHVDGRLGTGGLEVLGSSREMLRIVGNLLDNAVRHKPPGGAVRVEVSDDVEHDHAVVSVLDQCGGIEAADLDRVFDLAYRGDPARSPGAHSGGGLGLAIARGLVEAHAGRIDVGNEDGGCRFTVRIPRAR
jgi:signal transduction histidine kinase